LPDAHTTVVFVHGLWLTGHESAWLRRELKQLMGVHAVAFRYRSVVHGMAQNAAELGEFLANISSPEVHLVGHSMGGLVILKYFAGHPLLAPGRVVLLGAPLKGSQAAQNMAQFPWARMLMGKSIADEVIEPVERHWDGARDLGIIAGDLSFGLGRWMGAIAAPNDGTVLVEETFIDGARDHIVLPVSHTGMHFSRAVAEQCAQFLTVGQFLREPC
jgi:pimeloyl-ACP methyl ester carboxylesterase